MLSLAKGLEVAKCNVCFLPLLCYKAGLVWEGTLLSVRSTNRSGKQGEGAFKTSGNKCQPCERFQVKEIM